MPAPTDRDLDLLTGATHRLVRGVDALSDADLAEASLLPGWTRAHVVAHLALNAEGLAAVLDGLARGQATTMYPSQEARDADVRELAGAAPAQVRDRLMGSATVLAEAMAAVPDDGWDVTVERVPGGRTFEAGGAAVMRLCEVEIHHADLATAYSPDDWAPLTGALVVEEGIRRARGVDATLDAVDVGRSWTLGSGGTLVSGTAADLGWWLSGRDDRGRLSTESGTLPRLGAW